MASATVTGRLPSCFDATDCCAPTGVQHTEHISSKANEGSLALMRRPTQVMVAYRVWRVPQTVAGRRGTHRLRVGDGNSGCFRKRGAIHAQSADCLAHAWRFSIEPR